MTNTVSAVADKVGAPVAQAPAAEAADVHVTDACAGTTESDGDEKPEA